MFVFEGGFGGKEGEVTASEKGLYNRDTSSSCQSETSRQQILHPRHSILNEELITGFIFTGEKKKGKKRAVIPTSSN